MLKKFGKWFWNRGLDLVFMTMGVASVVMAYPKRDSFLLICGLYLLSMPLIDGKLRLLVEQGHIVAISSMAQALKLREEVLEKEAAKGCGGKCECEAE